MSEPLRPLSAEWRERLGEWLSDALAKPLRVRDAGRITVGHSRAMYRVDTTVGPLVIRMEQQGVFGTDSTEELRVMAAVGRTGFPVAPVRAHEPTGAVLGRPFFVMDFVAGDPAAGTPAQSAHHVADERALSPAAAEHFVTVLRDLHALDPGPLQSAFAIVPSRPSDATHAQIDRWLLVARGSAPEPIALLEEAAAWLHHFAPPLARLSVVHGDPGPGNLIHRDERIVAVTDWEFAHLGDPAEDWSFCLTMRGARTLPRTEWLSLYERLAGVTYEPARWTYWEAFNLFKGACANRTCLQLFESGLHRAPNMAIIGTTLHQVFLRRLVDITAHPLSIGASTA